MPTDSERQDAPGTAPALRLPSAWADYSKALAIYPISTLPPMTALNVTACSYAGTFYFGLVSARTIVPDLPRLAGYLDDAFAELAVATGVTGAAALPGHDPADAGPAPPDRKFHKKKKLKKKAPKKKALKKRGRKKTAAGRTRNSTA